MNELLSYSELVRRMRELEARHGMSSLEFLQRAMRGEADNPQWLEYCRARNALMYTYRRTHLGPPPLSREELDTCDGDMAEMARQAWDRLERDGKPPIFACLDSDSVLLIVE